MWGSLVISAAFAGDVTVCVDYDTDFVDSTGAGEDYYGTNGTKHARGIRVELEGPSAVYFAYADVGAPNPGCATVSVPFGATYTVRVKSKVQATSNHTVQVLDGGPGANQGQLFTRTRLQTVSGAPATYEMTLPVADHWNALAAAGRALTRNQGGRGSIALSLYVPDSSGVIDPPSGCSSSQSCVDGTDVWIHDDHVDRKFRIAHLMGWAFLHDMGYDRPSLVKSADDSHCHVSDRQLTLGNLETTVTGFLEGYAFWYASSAFNFSNESDCTLVFWEESNWDQLEVCHEEMEADVGHAVSCATGPSLAPYEPIVPVTNYRAYCLDERSPGLASASKPSDTVTPLDVVRFLKERVYVDGDLSRNGIGRIFAEAEPDAGDASDFRDALETECGVEGGDSTAWATAAGVHGLDQ